MSQKLQYVNDTIEEYDNKENHLSLHDLKVFLKSPRNFFFESLSGKKNEISLSLGLCIYEKMLNKQLFEEKYITSPKFDRRTKVGKDEYEKFINVHSQGKIIMPEETSALINNTVTNIIINKHFYDKITDADYGKSCYIIDEKTGLNVKLRLDVFFENKYVLDFQNSKESSPKQFQIEVDYNNHSLTAAFHEDFLGIKDYIFISCENKAPYQTCLYTLSKKRTNLGRKDYRMALDLLNWSFENSFWCDYTEFEILKNIYNKGDLKDAMSILQNQKKPLIYIL